MNARGLFVRGASWGLFFFQPFQPCQGRRVGVDSVAEAVQIDLREIPLVVIGVQAVLIPDVRIGLLAVEDLPQFPIVLFEFLDMYRHLGFSDDCHFFLGGQ